MQHTEISDDDPLTLNSNTLPLPSASYRAGLFFEDDIDDEGNVDDETVQGGGGGGGGGVSSHKVTSCDSDDLESSGEFSMNKETSFHSKMNSNPYHAFIYEVEISYYHGRSSSILELYVPKLDCSFNDCSGFCQQAGNVIKGHRGWQFLKKVVLTKEQFNTLQSWRDIEFNYRKEVSAVREKALNTCFGSSLKTVQTATALKPIFWFGEAEEEKFSIMTRAISKSSAAERAAFSLLRQRTSEEEREIFYRYASVRPKDFVVQLLIENSQKLYTSALKVQRNIKILYRRWKFAHNGKKKGGK